MGIFDKIFKKDESHYDSTNIRIHDLDVGFVFDYDLSTWEVQAIYEYDWGDNYFTREFKIHNGTDTMFLSLEEDDELELSLSKKVKVKNLGADVVESLMNLGKPPAKIEFEGREYLMEKKSPGYFHDIHGDNDNWVEFISWDFTDSSDEYVITIEQWGEQEFEASAGKYVKEFEITNILPGTNK